MTQPAPLAVPGDSLHSLIDALGVQYWNAAKRHPGFAQELGIDGSIDSALRAAQGDVFRIFAYLIQDAPDPIHGAFGAFAVKLAGPAQGNMGLLRHAHGAMRASYRMANDPVTRGFPVGAQRIAQLRLSAAPTALATAEALMAELAERIEAAGQRCAGRKEELAVRTDSLSKVMLDSPGRTAFARELAALRPPKAPASAAAPGSPAANQNDGAPTPNAELREVLAELDALTGLDEVKDRIDQIYCLTRLWQDRMAAGETVERPSLHLVFTGNPGTGKTTVARLVGRMLKAMGVLQKGHTLETDRSGLVADHIGGTALRTQQAIDKALDGVLFVDEAYALVPADVRGGRDFGHEALAILLKAMEDKRDRLVVILAGYPGPMDEMLASNDGLSSRFPVRIDFRDYTPEELGSIFDAMMGNRHYGIADDVRVEALERLEEERARGNFGNGRTVRNLVEALESTMARRLYGHELRPHLPRPTSTERRIVMSDVDNLPARLGSGAAKAKAGGSDFFPPGGGGGHNGGGFGGGGAPASPRRFVRPRLG